jgi:hypothetical protein
LALSSLSSRQSSEISELVSRVSSLSAQVDLLTEKFAVRTAEIGARYETAIQRAIASLESKFSADLHAIASATDARFEAKIRDQASALNERLESVIRQEITSADSKLTKSIDDQASAVNTRIEVELERQSRTVIGHCDSEIESRASAVTSRLETRIEGRCGANAASMRAELQEQDVRLREEILALRTMALHSMALLHGSKDCNFFPLRNAPLDGIIAWLGRRCGGNVIDKGLMVAGPGSNPRHAFDFQDSGTFYSHSGGTEQWLTIDFNQMRVYITDYSIRASSSSGDCIPRSWVLEGSNDGAAWFPLDTKTNRRELRDTARASTFQVSNPRLCRHLRFRKTAGCHTGDCLFLYLAAIEFFGFVSATSS